MQVVCGCGQHHTLKSCGCAVRTTTLGPTVVLIPTYISSIILKITGKISLPCFLLVICKINKQKKSTIFEKISSRSMYLIINLKCNESFPLDHQLGVLVVAIPHLPLGLLHSSYNPIFSLVVK